MTTKRVPGIQRSCSRCRNPIVFARVMVTDTGRGGGMMPFDPDPNDAGNFAVRALSRSTGLARALKKGESYDRMIEVLAMPHAATCSKRPGKGIADEAEAWLRERTGVSTDG